MNNQAIGLLGEEIAANYLQSSGLSIVEKNFKKRYGEIDIVAKDNDTLVFVEVKTRKGDRFGSPEEAITRWKLQSLIHSVNYYKLLHPELPKILRIDMVSINLSADHEVKNIKWYKNITG